MNKRLKVFLIFINIVMLVLAILWYVEGLEKEPLIVTLGQTATLLSLVFEKQATKIFTKNVDNSEVKIKKQKGDSIHTENVKDSKIKIE